jgi:6-phosphogluconolactonase
MVETIKPEVHVFDNLKNASQALAENIVKTSNKSIKSRNRFALALSGGKTPRLLYELVANEYSEKINWEAIHFFWGDERYVPKDHPDSNFAMAYNTLITKVPLPFQNVHSIPTEIETPEKAAESYEETLREFFEDSDEEVSCTFDAILLGVGEDGHTASLFPGSPALKEKIRWAVAVDAPASFLPKARITLTLPVINRSRDVFLLVYGDKKSSVVSSILEDPERSRKLYPAAMIEARERLIWYVDEETLERI